MPKWMVTRETNISLGDINITLYALGEFRLTAHAVQNPWQSYWKCEFGKYCKLLPRGTGWKQSAQQLGVGGGGFGWGGIRSLAANLRKPKSLYRSPPESAKGLRTVGRRAARFNQPATRLASNPDLQICKHYFTICTILCQVQSTTVFGASGNHDNM